MDKHFSFRQFSYFLIDYDGFLVDSEKLYFQSWCRLLNEEGKEVCKKYHEGRHESEVYKKVKDYLLKPMTLEEVSKAKREIYNQLIAAGKLELSSGIKNLLDELKKIAPMSIVSNSTKDVVLEGLKSTKTVEYFEELYCFNKDVNRKPAPDLYNLALSDLKLDRNSVLAFEDSVSGVEAAREAGVRVVCISSNPHTKDYSRMNNIVFYKSAEDAVSGLITTT